MTYKGITTQIQPTKLTCCHTVLAMVLGIPVVSFLNWIGEKDRNKGLDYFEVVNILSAWKIWWKKETFIIKAGWHICNVPSLNVPDGKHLILLHIDIDNTMRVFDPAPIDANRHAIDGSTLGKKKYIIRCYPKIAIPTPAAMLMDYAMF